MVVHSLRSRHGALGELSQDVDRVRRLGSPGVIGVGIDGPDDALTVDHEPSGDGQAPGSVAIAPGQVDAELEIDLAQVIGMALVVSAAAMVLGSPGRRPTVPDPTIGTG